MKRTLCICLLVILTSSFVFAQADAYVKKGDFNVKVGALIQTSRNYPAFLGDTVSLYTGGNRKKPCYVEITLEDMKYGKEASQIVSKANFLNSQPEAGKEYCLAYFHVSMQSLDTEETFSISESDFEAISQSGKVYTSHIISGLDDSIKIYSGGYGDFVVPVYIDEYDIPTLNYYGDAWFSIDDGTRAKNIQAREKYLSSMPENAYATTDFLHIGMDIDDLKGYIEEVYDIVPDIDNQSNGFIGQHYSKITFEELGCECDIYVLAEAVNKKVGAIFIIQPKYIEYNNILSDFNNIKDIYNKTFGQIGASAEAWTNIKDKDKYTQTEGLSKGLYVLRTFWKSESESLEICLNTYMTETGLVQDNEPRIWIGHYDPSFVKAFGEVNLK